MASFSATEALFKDHREAVDAIQEHIKKFHEHSTPFRVFHGSTNSTRPTSFSRSSVVDISRLDHVLYLDPETKTCLVQPNVDMWSLVNATLEEDLLPPVVPEFPGITVGGAFNGTAGESSSWKHGFFDRSVIYIQIILADGRIVHCGRDGAVKVPPLVYGDDANKDSPHAERENNEKLRQMGGGSTEELSNEDLKELFHAAIGSFGTLGVTTLFCLSLEQVAEGSMVLCNYQPVQSSTEAVSTIHDKIAEVNEGVFEKSGNGDEVPDFIDGILFDNEHGVIMTGRIVSPSDAQRLKWHDKIWTRNFVRPYNKWFYLHAEARMKQVQRKMHHKKVAAPKSDLIPLRQYLFRYDVSAFWMGKEAMAQLRWPYNRITRMITYPFISTRTLYGALHLSGAAGKYIIQDLIMPADDPNAQERAKAKSLKPGKIADAMGAEKPNPPKSAVGAAPSEVTASIPKLSEKKKSKPSLSREVKSEPVRRRKAAPEFPQPKIPEADLPKDILDEESLSQGLGINFNSFTPAASPSPPTKPTQTKPDGIEVKPPVPSGLLPIAKDPPPTGSSFQQLDAIANKPQATHNEPAFSSPDYTNPSSRHQSEAAHKPSTTSTAPLISSQATTAAATPSEVSPNDSTHPARSPPSPTSSSKTMAADAPEAPTTPQEADEDTTTDTPPVLDMINWLDQNLGVYPLWLCPIRGHSPAPMHQHAPGLSEKEPGMLLNVGVWGPPHTQKLNKLLPNDANRGYDPTNQESRTQWLSDNRAIEGKVQELGGKKWLYAQTFYSDEEKLFSGVGMEKDRWEGKGGLRERFGARGLPGLWEKIGHKESVEGTQTLRRTWGLLAVFGFTGLLTWA